ncbi:MULTISPECIES: glutamine-hydrolyzing carbamoyl-phosphate synthase small subunit [Acetobacterium]|jgi:carbamoyl-phosphate synthase small subunit|uniref:Carbamoyl phosphate synthase small chain n=2 Tax=Acetobacterium TaxID=33951 RepID=A0A5D0WTY6_9FIRM|nr:MULTISPECIES: glutamine-hydrolyzing carbamoyl-phosphate synthase small subunit [Acetobacterium]MBC3899886.1 glutamine-hydrolyzing carbamoyl-phosphate synthase small subunit [Acetobacterium malicum]TYC87577.1 glutamine-hydrolyzing carbamoyl-phosphate synthase small subunit [Acetobacterium wieringae]
MSYYKRDKRAWLVLSDGSVFEGYNFGCEGTTIGEIVFTTGMTGYQEVLTDPSYYGQIVLQTYPLIGNYGINSDDMESERSWINGYITKEWCEEPSNFRNTHNINEFMIEQDKIGIWDVDTRAITRVIREHGTMNGAITTEDIETTKEALMEKIHAFKVVNPVQAVTRKNKGWYYSQVNRANHVALIDYGYKHNILRMLLRLGCNVTVMPANTTIEEIRMLNPDGIMLSNGPGDPAENIEIIENLKDFVKYGKPIFGICLGHQLLALAMGGETFKLKYGHRGMNQPVKDVTRDRVFITSQNHGYAVVPESIPAEVGKVTHFNLNDGTCEGVEYPDIHAFTVQFHPEASAGPNDTGYLFEQFTDLMERGQQGCL